MRLIEYCSYAIRALTVLVWRNVRHPARKSCFNSSHRFSSRSFWGTRHKLEAISGKPQNRADNKSTVITEALMR